MLSALFSHEDIWGGIACGIREATESERKSFSEFHDETIDRLRKRKEGRKNSAN